MPTDRQLDERISGWLEVEAPSQLPDRVLRATFERTRQTRQQGRWQALLGRIDMNRTFLALGGAAAVVVVAGALAFGLPRSGDGPGVGAQPSTSATVAPSATPAPSAEPSVTQVGLPEGPFVLLNGAVTHTVQIPGHGWDGDPTGGILIKNNKADPPDGAGMIVFADDLFVYGDPCAWSTTAPDSPATTVDEAVAALSAQKSRDASDPVAVTVDGYAGKSITLHVPDDAVISECDQGFFGSWTVPGFTQPERYHQGPGQIDELWILDVEGELVVISAAYYEGTPAEDVEDMRAIVESSTFE